MWSFAKGNCSQATVFLFTLIVMQLRLTHTQYFTGSYRLRIAVGIFHILIHLMHILSPPTKTVTDIPTSKLQLTQLRGCGSGSKPGILTLKSLPFELHRSPRGFQVAWLVFSPSAMSMSSNGLANGPQLPSLDHCILGNKSHKHLVFLFSKKTSHLLQSFTKHGSFF